VNNVLFGVFILSGLLSAFAGWLLAARTNGSSPGIGVGMLFEAFAAVVIGGVSLQGGVGRLTGVFAGAILLSAISTAISILGMPPFYMNIIRGGFIIIAVLIDAIISRIRPWLMR
jgi:ribose transport system permease protein